jgi:hypothetical protein
VPSIIALPRPSPDHRPRPGPVPAILELWLAQNRAEDV